MDLGGQVECRILKETTEGGGVPATGELAFLSDAVKELKLRVKGNREKVYDIGQITKATDTISGVAELEVVAKYRYQDHATVVGHVADLIDRNANGNMNTYVMELVYAADASTKHYATLKGLSCEEAKLSVDEDGTFFWEVTWKFLELVTATAQPSIGTATRQTAAYGTAFFLFTGGDVEAPAGTPVAIATQMAGMTVKHNLKAVKDIGNTKVIKWAPGRRQFNVQLQITAENGAKALVDAARDGTEVNIVIETSATAGKPKFTIANCDINDLEVPVDDEAAVVTVDLDREGENITIGTV